MEYILHIGSTTDLQWIDNVDIQPTANRYAAAQFSPFCFFVCLQKIRTAKTGFCLPKLRALFTNNTVTTGNNSNRECVLEIENSHLNPLYAQSFYGFWILVEYELYHTMRTSLLVAFRWFE